MSAVVVEITADFIQNSDSESRTVNAQHQVRFQIETHLVKAHVSVRGKHMSLSSSDSVRGPMASPDPGSMENFIDCKNNIDDEMPLWRTSI